MKKIKPGPGQESVWNYPRPPRVEASDRHVEIFYAGDKIADSRAALRVLETSHPPVYYLPRTDLDMTWFVHSWRRTFCEWKGIAVYYHLIPKLGPDDETQIEDAAWSYPDPLPPFSNLRDLVAVYPSKMDDCRLDGERVQAQEGDFYGGWITADIVGPFKGAPGTVGW